MDYVKQLKHIGWCEDPG